LFFVVLALMTYVMPKFKSILGEMFEGQLPPATGVLMRIADFIAYQIHWSVWLLVLLTALILVPFLIRARFRPRRPDKPHLSSRIADFIKWHLPVLRWFENNYSMVQTIEILGLSLRAGSPVNESIANTLSLDVNNCFGKRLRRWLARVEAGGNISAAVRESRLPAPLAWAFDEKVNHGNTLAILEALESFYRTNYSYRVNLMRLMAGPFVTIIMGLMVGFVAYAFLSPMVAIIYNLANSVMP